MLPFSLFYHQHYLDTALSPSHHPSQPLRSDFPRVSISPRPFSHPESLIELPKLRILFNRLPLPYTSFVTPSRPFRHIHPITIVRELQELVRHNLRDGEYGFGSQITSRYASLSQQLRRHGRRESRSPFSHEDSVLSAQRATMPETGDFTRSVQSSARFSEARDRVRCGHFIPTSVLRRGAMNKV